MKSTLVKPTCLNGTLRFEFVKHLNGELRPKQYTAVLSLDGEELGRASVVVQMDWLASAIRQAFLSFGLTADGYKVCSFDFDNGSYLASKAKDFELPLWEESVWRNE